MNPILIKLVGYFAAVAFLFGSGYLTARQHWQQKLEAFKTSVELEAAKQAAKSAEISRQATIATQEIESAHKTSVDRLHAFYRRLLDARASSGAMPGIPDAPTRIDEVPTDALPLAGQCAETTEQLEALIAWVNRQKMIH